MKQGIKKLIFLIMITSAGLLIALLAVIGFDNHEFIDRPLDIEGDSLASATSTLPDSISITSWNLGYAGLGAEGEFKVDGGKRIFPVSDSFVKNHISNICGFIASDSSDIKLFQEVAKKSHLIYENDLYSSIKNTLSSFYHTFSPSIHLKHFPIIGPLCVGNSIFSRYAPETAMRYSLPADNNLLTKHVSLKYNFILHRYPIAGSNKFWSVINLHFSAFDKGGKLRKKQLEKLFSVLLDEYQKGNYVVAGGDWNHRLTKTDFPYTTKEKFLFWVKDLPPDITPPGWAWGIDHTSPTVRTVERPYHQGENYTCIIDGFLVSPNVEIVRVSTSNFHFQDSDHNPVTIHLRRKTN